MSKTGGVLTKSSRSFLFNQGITPKELGLYQDSVSGEVLFFLKKEGHSIPLNAKTKVQTTCFDAGAYKTLMVELDPNCPCDLCDYEYGIEIVSFVQKPGVRNSEVTDRQQYYGGVMKMVECDEGKIIDSQVLEMENNIITQINTYEPFNRDGIMPAQTANRYYLAQDGDTSTISELIITIDGVEYPIASVMEDPGVVDPVTLVMAINEDAGIDGRVKAAYVTDPTGADYNFIIYSDSGVLFTVAAGTDVTLARRGMLIHSRNKDFQITIKMNPSIGTVAGVNLAKFTINTSGADNYHFTFSNGDSGDNYVVNENEDCIGADNAWNFDALSEMLLGDSDWIATKIVDGEEILAIGPLNNPEAYVFEGCHGLWDLQLHTERGAWPTLTSDDVFRVFSHDPNYGGLAQKTYLKQPIDGMRYCKVTISWETEIADLVGANHMNARRGDIHLYYPACDCCSDLWGALDLMDENPGQGADTSLCDIFAMIKENYFEGGFGR